jgi:hypothetical protein
MPIPASLSMLHQKGPLPRFSKLGLTDLHR